MSTPLNGHAVGIILKELMRRAIVTIRNERQVFEATVKRGYHGDMNDVFTSADTKAQAVYMKSLRQCFPDIPVIAEEGTTGLGTASPTYFTVDPLDGTKAFIRRQSHGVGTMVALIENGQVTAAYVGDINTQEIYGFRPGSTAVHRITEYETSEVLTPASAPLATRYVLLRDPPDVYSETARNLLKTFKSYEIEGGSIGTWMARLWKDEVGALLLPPSIETPWDAAPVIGICTRMQFGFYRPNGPTWLRYDPILSPTLTHRDHDLLVINPRLAPPV
jgi:fructose-1,6-bisphosphatase/inositol monophosphatase family enzyme